MDLSPLSHPQFSHHLNRKRETDRQTERDRQREREFAQVAGAFESTSRAWHHCGREPANRVRVIGPDGDMSYTVVCNSLPALIFHHQHQWRNNIPPSCYLIIWTHSQFIYYFAFPHSQQNSVHMNPWPYLECTTFPLLSFMFGALSAHSDYCWVIQWAYSG